MRESMRPTCANRQTRSRKRPSPLVRTGRRPRGSAGKGLNGRALGPETKGVGRAIGNEFLSEMHGKSQYSSSPRSPAITCGAADTKLLLKAPQPFIASGGGCARLWLGMTKPVELHKTTGSTHVRVRSPAIATDPKPSDLVAHCFGLTDFKIARRKQGSRARHAVHAATLQVLASDRLFQLLPNSPIEPPISPSMDSRALIARGGRPLLK